MGKLVLIVGGVRSGKSRFAQELAGQLSEDVLFVATAEARDDEMQRRIDIHQQTRPASWRTCEIPLHLADGLRQAAGAAPVVVIDCLTLWVSNLILQQGEDPDPVWAEATLHTATQQLLEVCRDLPGQIIVVSGEVGQGVVPEHPLGRLYRDLLGWTNQKLATAAAAVYLMVAGLAVDVRQWAETPQSAARRLKDLPETK